MDAMDADAVGRLLAAVDAAIAHRQQRLSKVTTDDHYLARKEPKSELYLLMHLREQLPVGAGLSDAQLEEITAWLAKEDHSRRAYLEQGSHDDMLAAILKNDLRLIRELHTLIAAHHSGGPDNGAAPASSQ